MKDQVFVTLKKSVVYMTLIKIWCELLLFHDKNALHIKIFTKIVLLHFDVLNLKTKNKTKFSYSKMN